MLTTTSNLLLKLLEVNKKRYEQQEVIDGHSKQSTEQSDKINKLEQKVLEQGWSMKEQDAEINALFNKISELEIRVENQEQYSR